MGSKNRHSREITKAISDDLGLMYTEYPTWVEPFVGGANMIDKIYSKKRIGNDINKHLISLFENLQNGWLPPDNVSEIEYKEAHKKSKDFSLNGEPLIGFIGIGCSYSGKWFGGYARGNDSKGNSRNYCLESKKNLLKQLPKIQEVDFYWGDYVNMAFPPKSIIYCDPPYAETTKYKTDFNHETFWKWCDEQIKDGHKVYVSEYNAPLGWKCIWKKEVNNSLTKDTGSKKGTEKLFTK